MSPLPWWRTVWAFRRRVRSGSGRLLRGLVVLAVLLALAAGGFLLLPAGRSAVEDIRDKLGKAEEIGPVKVSADAQAPGHPASAATDGLTNTYWGAPAVGDSVSCRFAEPFRLVAVVVHTGASKTPAEFRAQARPVRADLVVTSQDGTRHTEELTFSDKPGQQTVHTGISDVVEVRLVVRAAAGAAEGRHIALGELEFFRRS
ncbi:NADase-type glycan-binding domain-containing protein [Streptomyces qinglanensis]|uniref:NADase-type glycan-binding domain-containing protein n=1 Tax=Streptomyces qinglanensis TaxID=943816 RepID=UPI003D746C7C